MMEKIKQDIETAYGSLERPDWSFVARRMKDGLYDSFVTKLAELGSVQETTDQNDDYSRCLFISDGTLALTLRLSFVGKYACIHDVNGRFLSGADLLMNMLGAKLSRLLKSSDVELLGDGVLRREIRLGEEECSLYEVMFSSDGLIL